MDQLDDPPVAERRRLAATDQPKSVRARRHWPEQITYGRLPRGVAHIAMNCGQEGRGQGEGRGHANHPIRQRAERGMQSRAWGSQELPHQAP